MKYILNIFLFFGSTTLAFSQYWFGPKIGLSHIEYLYQESDYENDFEVPENLNFQLGFALNYEASPKYSIYAELIYERVGKKLKDLGTGGEQVTTTMTNGFISVPFMLRITFNQAPIHYYFNLGPKVSYWLNGSGSHQLAIFDDFAPFGRDGDGKPKPRKYDIIFNSSKRGEGKALIVNPDRIKFALGAGVGMFLDLVNGTRLMFDLRYTWGHSNLALNSDEDELIYLDFYRENLEYTHNFLTFSVGYLLNYNADLQRRGKSSLKIK